MKTRPYCAFLSLLASLLFLHSSSFGWGFFAHKWINRVAIESLPDEIRPFFQSHQTYLSKHAIDPDLWRQDDPDEQYRHYIDIDMYGRYPFKELPRSSEQATKKFGEETVVKRGIAPWWVVQTYKNLVEAMQAGEPDSIIFVSAALGHYVSDLHMPLHNVENYDGKLTGNKGIHARFERWMIERYSEDMQLTVAKARRFDVPLDAIFEVVLESVQFADAILEADTRAKVSGRVYQKSEDYDAEYYGALFKNAGGLAEKRMSQAAHAVGSFWYSAWIEAGKPELALNPSH
ncbi:MAG: S1/P1 nuclease [Nitrososphaerales archaeon]